jgi:thermitase
LNNPDNVDIDAPAAWSVTTGTPATIVAVLDTGIDLSNPEFAGRIWVNPNGGSGADGYVGDVNGWNFVNNTGNVWDDNGHGTHVTGILAAAGNNGYGVVGVDWNATIMPVKILDNSGGGTTDAAVNGIYFAVEHGARVINASWGGGPSSQALADAINYAGNYGVVFVTAAGNGLPPYYSGRNNDKVASYPADYRLPNEIAVAAIDQSGNLASFSNFGAHTVDLAAPGVNILSTVPGGFAYYSGTSMATPYVAGVVALLVGLRPEFTAAQLVQRILATTKPLPSLAGKTITGGMVDAASAINPSTLPLPPSSGVTVSGGPQLVPNGTSGDDLQNAILSTNDYYSAQGGTPGAFVAGLYRSLLGRDPEPAGFNYFVGLLQGGMSRSQLIKIIQGTDEAKRTEVARWYQEELGWAEPLATLKVDPGVMHWAGMLDTGVSDDNVLNAILATNDFFVVQGGTAISFITGLYHALLGRDPEPAGLNYFVGLYQAGMSRTDLIRVIQNSFEARRTEVARWYQDELGWTTPLDTLKVDPGVMYWAGFLAHSG